MLIRFTAASVLVQHVRSSRFDSGLGNHVLDEIRASGDVSDDDVEFGGLELKTRLGTGIDELELAVLRSHKSRDLFDQGFGSRESIVLLGQL